MNIQPDPFEKVTKLLVIKRYEKPPPGYFEVFSDRILARIQAAEEAQALPWWQRLGWSFGFKPALAGAFGVFLSTGLLAGLFFMAPGDASQAGAPELGMMQNGQSFGMPASVAAAEPEVVRASTEPVPSAIPSSSPFSQPMLMATRVSMVVH